MNKINLKFNFREAYNKMFVRITVSLLNSILSILLSILLFANDVIDKDTPYFWGIALTLIALLIVSVVSVFNEHKKEDAYIYSEYLQKDIENNALSKDRTDLINMIFETREFIGFVFNFLILSKTSRSIDIFKSGNITEAKNLLNSYFKEFLFYKLRAIFGRNKDENFSLAIYLYDKEKDVLWDFLSKKAKKINKKEDSGRDWTRIACSHIAFCFNHQLELIHSDIPKRFKEFGLSTDSFNDKDLDNYKSAITLPIFFRTKNEKKIVGVFCLTSDNVDTFHEVKDNITDPVYSLKIYALRILIEVLAENLSMLYENDENKIKKILIENH